LLIGYPTVATARYKFRLGDYQAITLRCDSRIDGLLRCRARGRLGRVQWATELRVTDEQIASFVDALEQLLPKMTGVAELNVSGEGAALMIRVAVDTRGAIQTDYEVTGWTGDLRRSPWRASGSYVCWPQHYFKRLASSQSVSANPAQQRTGQAERSS